MSHFIRTFYDQKLVLYTHINGLFPSFQHSVGNVFYMERECLLLDGQGNDPWNSKYFIHLVNKILRFLDGCSYRRHYE